MTELQSLHNTEQTAALRREFQDLWHDTLLPRMKHLHQGNTDTRMVQDIAWQSYRAAFELAKSRRATT